MSEATDTDDTARGGPTRVFRGIMEDLEAHRVVPGQRLVETELALRFGVGRNAVREAMQRLAGRGVVDLSRNRSASIRKLDAAETMEVLDVAGAMSALAVRAAARSFVAERHAAMMESVIADLAGIDPMTDPATFGRVRRQFYRVMLEIGGNRELQRLFPAIGIHIIYSQYQSPLLRMIRVTDYRAICSAITAGDERAGEKIGRDHVEHVRAVIARLR